MPLPVHYTLVSLESEDLVKAYNPLRTYIEKKFGKEMPVQEIGLRKIYDKLFSENQEHIVFTGQESAGLMTVDESVVWFYRDRLLYNTPTTFSIADNALVMHMIIRPDPLKIGCTFAVPVLICFLYRIFLELIRSSSRRSYVPTKVLMV